MVVLDHQKFKIQRKHSLFGSQAEDFLMQWIQEISLERKSHIVYIDSQLGLICLDLLNYLKYMISFWFPYEYTSGNLNSHMRLHSWRCEICSLTFPDQNHLRQHELQCHPTLPPSGPSWVFNFQAIWLLDCWSRLLAEPSRLIITIVYYCNNVWKLVKRIFWYK